MPYGKRRSLIQGAMKNTKSQKAHSSGVLAKLSSDPQPHRNKPRKRRTPIKYKMYNKQAGRFEYGTKR